MRSREEKFQLRKLTQINILREHHQFYVCTLCISCLCHLLLLFLIFVIAGKEAIQTQSIIIAKPKQISKSKRALFSQVSKILKSSLTNHSTNLVSERSWSFLRRLKKVL